MERIKIRKGLITIFEQGALVSSLHADPKEPVVWRRQIRLPCPSPEPLNPETPENFTTLLVPSAGLPLEGLLKAKASPSEMFQVELSHEAGPSGSETLQISGF